MSKKYHLDTQIQAPRNPRIGKYGVVDWREDCAGCHNCVKKACVYDRYRQEAQYIRGLSDVNAIFFECMGCFSCVQKCTKGLLSLAINPIWEQLGNEYWTPEIIETTWYQAESAKIPVSGAGYRGRFSGAGFDSMWTDMSEIVRPTRDGIHGREYISTAVDIGRKPPYLLFGPDWANKKWPVTVEIPMPLILDLMPAEYDIPDITAIINSTAEQAGILNIIDWRDWEKLGDDRESYLHHIVFYLDPYEPLPPKKVLQKVRLIEIADDIYFRQRVENLHKSNPELIVAVRVILDGKGVERALELAAKGIDVIHLVADSNGNEISVKYPRFIKDMVRQIHNALIKNGRRNEITLIAGGGIALAEHMAKQIICGADLVSIDIPLLIALECRLCKVCNKGSRCPANIDEVSHEYGVRRMTNLIIAWHDQLIEVMGAMGIRDVRRLRGETGRALFFEELEEDTFGRLFGKRNRA